MIVRMSQAAKTRRAHEWLTLAEVIAIGVASGFSGKSEGIESLARSLGIPLSGRPSRSVKETNVEELMRKFRARGGG